MYCTNTNLDEIFIYAFVNPTYKPYYKKKINVYKKENSFLVHILHLEILKTMTNYSLKSYLQIPEING